MNPYGLLQNFWIIIASIFLTLSILHFVWSRKRLGSQGFVGKVIGVSTGIVEAIGYMNKHFERANVAQAVGFLIASGAALASYIYLQ